MFLTDKLHIRIGDFGSAQMLPPGECWLGNSVFGGTPEYVCPELLDSNPISSASDAWSVGCMLYACLGGAPPFVAANEYYVMEKIEKADYVMPPGICADAADLISRLLVLDPAMRLGNPEQGGMAALLSHRFFAAHLPAVCGLAADVGMPVSEEASCVVVAAIEAAAVAPTAYVDHLALAKALHGCRPPTMQPMLPRTDDSDLNSGGNSSSISDCGILGSGRYGDCGSGGSSTSGNSISGNVRLVVAAACTSALLPIYALDVDTCDIATQELFAEAMMQLL
jgi:serine/threonine protein kinase